MRPMCPQHLLVLAALSLAGAGMSEAHAASRSARFVAIDMDLPELGTDRRVVLADMRRLGARLLDDKEGRLVFEGGPLGWNDVAQTAFHFDGVKLTKVELVFKTPVDDQNTRELFFIVRRALGERLGRPWFDRVRDTADKQGPASLALQAHATTWTNNGQRVQLAGAYGAERGVKLVLTRHVQAAELDNLEETGDVAEQRHWAVKETSPLALKARAAADALLDDFGEQDVVLKGAKQKGEPLTLRLRSVRLPREAEGVSAKAIAGRFERFVRGHWDVEGEDRRADLELNIEIVPTVEGPRTTFVMRLDAVIASGKDRGKTVYAATQQIN